MNKTASLHGAGLLIIGLFMFSVAPPLAVILIAIAYFVQRSFRKKIRREQARRRTTAREKLARARILAAKSLP